MAKDDDDVEWIRATQGHNSRIQIDMVKLCGPIMREEDVSDDEICCHGTYKRLYDEIVARG